ncbi:MAG: hypothetical protein INF74_03285 [Roseomonas sp.]|nr:hypothetical protein [Roseomonas sp.]
MDTALAEPDIEGLSLHQLAAGLSVSAAATHQHCHHGQRPPNGRRPAVIA